MPDIDPEDWFDKGYTSVLSVTPPNAKVRDAGKRPGRWCEDEQRWDSKGWNTYHASRVELKTWQSWGANLGLRNDGDLFLLDIDALDPDTSNVVRHKAEKLLGEAPVRVGRYPKQLLMYRASEPMATHILPYSAGDRTDRIETVGVGKQAVVQGTHPSGSEYTWDRPVPALSDLSVVTPEMAERFFAELSEMLPEAKLTKTAIDDGSARNPESLLGDPALVRDALFAIPNDENMQYEPYIAVAQAVRGAFGPGNEDEALDLFMEWAETWTGDHNPEAVYKHWATMKPSRTAGAGSLYRRAESHGWKGRAQVFFKPVDPDQIATNISVNDMFAQNDNGPRKLKFLFRDDIRNRKAPPFMIKRHIPAQSVGFLYSEPGCGKTFMALDMSMHIAYGLPEWHGDALSYEKNSWVVYLSQEGTGQFDKRMRAWEKSNLTPVNAQCRLALTEESLNFMQESDVKAVIDSVKNLGLENIAMIVVDTVSRVLPGADENLQKDMTLFVKACDALRNEFDCVVMGVHHAGKGGGGLRGSSVLKGAGDFVFSMDKSKHNPLYRILHCEKQKDARDGWSEAYAMNIVTLDPKPDQDPDEDNESVVLKRAAGSPESEEIAPALSASMLDFIEAAWVRGKPLSKAPQAKDRYGPRRLSQEFGISSEQASAVLELWENTGQIVQDVRDSRAKMSGYRVVRDDSDTDVSSEEAHIFG